MISVEDKIVINRPIEQVFSFAANPDNFPQFQSDVVKSKVITEGPLRVGSKFEEVVRIVGRSVETVCEITEYDHPRKMSFKSVSSQAINYGGDILLDVVDGGTQVNLAARASLRGLWRLAEPLFAGEARRGVADELRKLKTVLEKSERQT